MATRWAICGTGKIAIDFCLCLRSLPRSEHEIVAVAARDKGRAEAFAARFDIAESFGSYEDLAKLSNIDVIYIATYHSTHVENSLMYINAGKNVLCEKPMSLTLEGCQRVITAAKEKNVLFIDAIWVRQFPAYKYMKEYLDSGAIGDIIMVQATFCAPLLHVERLSDPTVAGGGLMEMGIYPVQLANLILKGRPESVLAEGSKTESGVDKTSVILLKYPGNKLASLAYSMEASLGAGTMVVRGTKGNLVIPDRFWCADTLVLADGEVKHFPLPEVKGSEDMTFWNAQGLTYEAMDVRECLLKGLKESPNITHKDSQDIMYILQEVQKKIGISFDFP